jgi:myo-inositol-1(or 4)-monophosphatase
MPEKDILEMLWTAQEIAHGAGKILAASRGGGFGVRTKGEATNLVTEVDMASERYITQRIREEFPQHGIVAEEGGGDVRQDQAFVWYVDPLDGTTNYTHDYPFFCVSLALYHEDRPLLGVVVDPVRDEMFSAASGWGSFLNGRRIRASSVDTLEKALLVTGFPYDIRHHPENNLNYFKVFLFRSQALRRDGSAALNLCYVACGRFDGMWEMRLKPWDMAAGRLIVEEALGKVTTMEGAPFALRSDSILATNGTLHGALLAGIASAKEGASPKA